jgi:hypothetical protein
VDVGIEELAHGRHRGEPHALHPAVQAVGDHLHALDHAGSIGSRAVLQGAAQVVDGIEKRAGDLGAGRLDLALAFALDAIAEGLAVVQGLCIGARDLVDPLALALDLGAQRGDLFGGPAFRRGRRVHGLGGILGGLVTHGRAT